MPIIKPIDNRYEIIKQLHKTNFSITYQGKDTKNSNRLCLIKQLNINSYNSQVQQKLKERFEREAQTLEKLGKHSQIPDSCGFISENNQFYLIQEWIEGYNLAETVQKQRKLKETQVKDILIKLLPVLDFIHNQIPNIIHRDIKPSNIMVNAKGLPILIDFGIIKEIVTSTNTQRPLTDCIGTPGFMAPEQKAGKPIPASDLFSLGITAIYLLTGKLPNGKLSWRSDAPNISSEFADILDKSIEENSSDRYQSATEMLYAITIPKTIPITIPKTPHSIPPTEPSPDPNQKVSPVSLTNQGNSEWLKMGIAAILAGIISAGTTLVIFSTNKTPSAKTTEIPQPSPANLAQENLDRTIQKAEIAISKAEAAQIKLELETARNELQIAIQELKNIPRGQGVDNEIQTKELEYSGIINQINQGLNKPPCYEWLWATEACQEYPVQLLTQKSKVKSQN